MYQHLIFLYYDGYTLYIAVPSKIYQKPTLFAVAFDNLDNNDNYTIYNNITTSGYGWRDFDVISSLEILAWEDINILALPLVCCLCSDYMVLTYDINKDLDNGVYNFMIESIGDDTKRIDVTGRRVYSKGDTSVRVHAVDGETRYFEPDLSSKSSKIRICSLLSSNSMLIILCVIQASL